MFILQVSTLILNGIYCTSKCVIGILNAKKDVKYANRSVRSINKEIMKCLSGNNLPSKGLRY